jgi:hypothetical protein
MRTRRLWCGLLATLAVAGLPAPGGAQPVGSEFQVNTYTTGHQRTWQVNGGHLVAADASGNFVVVWWRTQPGSGIFGQRYDSTGGPVGSEFQVNSDTTDGLHPSVASAASGDFVVVWTEGQSEGDPYWGIVGRRFDSEGVPQGDEFQVNTYTPNVQTASSVASDAAGNFVVVWTSGTGNEQDVFGQRFDSGGVPQGDEFLVNSYTTRNQALSSVASDASGNFVVVWRGEGQGDDQGIFGQRYDSAGGPLGNEFRVNSYTTYPQALTNIASAASGSFIVVWVSYQGGSSVDVFGQRYDGAGLPQGDEFRVNSYRPSYQTDPSIASDASGNFVVVWDSLYQDGSSHGVFGQHYDSAGVAQGGEFQINSYTTGIQQIPSVGATGRNQFVAVWESNQDGSGLGVFGRQIDTIKVLSPNDNVAWRIGSLHQIQWTHNLGLAATFRIELDRDDNGNYEELIAAHADVDNATRGSFAWTVTGPPSATARVRISWTDDLSVSDASDSTFQIGPPELTATESPLER